MYHLHDTIVMYTVCFRIPLPTCRLEISCLTVAACEGHMDDANGIAIDDQPAVVMSYCWRLFVIKKLGNCHPP